MQTIVIIGAGFSGTLTAAWLLRLPADRPRRIVLVNRGQFARGIAYGTQSTHHVLNVPAGNMSAFADDPTHFLRFAQEANPSITGGTFVSRQLYGQYLERVLATAEAEASANVTLQRVVGDVVDLEVRGPTAEVRFRDGTSISADRVALACGNYVGRHGSGWALHLEQQGRYVRDPWAHGVFEAINPGERILVIGTGLTMFDVALELRSRRVKAPILALSRRGLVPSAHRSPARAPTADCRPPGIETMEPTTLGYFRAVRDHVKALAGRHDWRDVIGSLRPITPLLWQRLPRAERDRFLRHVRPHWEVHRHRAAPEVHAAISEMTATGVLQPMAGRILDCRSAGDHVEVRLRRRGATDVESFAVDRVINCTGPESDPHRIDDRLIALLLDRGHLTADDHGIGVSVNEAGALIGASGEASPVLYHVGPLLKSRYWEATAVPELRVHAQRLANVLAAETSNTPQPA
jgi:uncharacterized NAD(P)/FAD-binding protein YdhS